MQKSKFKFHLNDDPLMHPGAASSLDLRILEDYDYNHDEKKKKLSEPLL